MRSYKVTLKICKKKKVYDEFDKIYFDDIVKEEIIELDNENPFNKVKVVEDWKKTIWDYAFIRSLEIWGKLSIEKIGSSLGGISTNANRSLSGKLGNGNGKFCKKNSSEEWFLINFIEKRRATFKPLSIHAKKKCIARAMTLKQSKVHSTVMSNFRKTT